MENNINNLNNPHTLRGTLIMLAGLTLLLHTLGLIEVGISFVLVVIALTAIVYGFYTSGLYEWFNRYLLKK